MGKNSILWRAGHRSACQADQNLVLSNILQAFNEGIVLTQSWNRAPMMLDILTNSAAKSGLIEYKAPFIFRAISRRTSPSNGCTRTLAHAGICRRVECAASAYGFDAPNVSGAIATAWNEDICSTIKVLEGIAGVEVKDKVLVSTSTKIISIF